jgi:thiol:disulfide interchange protein DsbD
MPAPPGPPAASTPATPGAGGSPAPAPESAAEHRASLERVYGQLPKKSPNAAAGAGDNPAGPDDRSGLLAFVLAGAFWGAVSLVTPCVFPMIPITVSFFLKQSEKEHHRPMLMASVYCGTIIMVLTVAAVVLLSVFRGLSVNPIMNIALGALFVYFALSLFGMYDIELPRGLARYTSAQEGQGGLAGTVFMALTFTIVSFACVAPFLGGFGGTTASAQSHLGERLLGGLAFSVTFASPFFVLALFPALLRKMPKSGSWLNSIKVVMGFLELAAALVFFRTAEVRTPHPIGLFTYDFVLSLYVAISFLCGLYLLNVYRLPHDSPLENIGVLRMVFGLLFVGLGMYLVPALFKYNPEGEKQRPTGLVYAWVDAFLLPESRRHWGGDLEQAVAEARAQRSQAGARGERPLVFVDFTGVTCKNCKYNEEAVFAKPEFKDLLGRFRLVQLYTDTVPAELYPPGLRGRLGPARQEADAEANLDFQKKAFNTEQLPLYVVLEPLPNDAINVVGVYSEGKINDEAGFARFLRNSLEGPDAGAQARGP